MGTYEDVFRASTEDPESFWLRAAEAIDWDVTPQHALDSSGAPFYRWFPDGRLNVAPAMKPGHTKVVTRIAAWH
ncbi:acetyl-coenzyme A synthetase N-terminal domain-containing protein [Streptomyces sp. NL15-2K]|uniref:acetyl-coenzyme A synthetase N-terminal domain-containing protein n=1 Tax=Streptomyces sp. NL15-2K TaxID=376149 RepID=UPI0032AFD78E